MKGWPPRRPSTKTKGQFRLRPNPRPGFISVTPPPGLQPDVYSVTDKAVPLLPAEHREALPRPSEAAIAESRAMKQKASAVYLRDYAYQIPPDPREHQATRIVMWKQARGSPDLIPGLFPGLSSLLSPEKLSGG